MYIIETFRGIVKIDADELIKLRDEQGKQLIFFRQGAVNPNQIVRVVEDLDRKKDIPKMVNESEEEYAERLASSISEDIFAPMRVGEVDALPNRAGHLRLKS